MQVGIGHSATTLMTTLEDIVSLFGIPTLALHCLSGLEYYPAY